MICIEDYSSLIPPRAGKIVGCATHRGDYVIVACEHGLFKLWDDYSGQARVGELERAEVKAGVVQS